MYFTFSKIDNLLYTLTTYNGGKGIWKYSMQTKVGIDEEQLKKTINIAQWLAYSAIN